MPGGTALDQYDCFEALYAMGTNKRKVIKFKTLLQAKIHSVSNCDCRKSLSRGQRSIFINSRVN